MSDYSTSKAISLKGLRRKQRNKGRYKEKRICSHIFKCKLQRQQSIVCVFVNNRQISIIIYVNFRFIGHQAGFVLSFLFRTLLTHQGQGKDYEPFPWWNGIGIIPHICPPWLFSEFCFVFKQRVRG